MSQETSDRPPKDTAWHAEAASDALKWLESDDSSGLSSDEARTRLERYGPNRLPPPR